MRFFVFVILFSLVLIPLAPAFAQDGANSILLEEEKKPKTAAEEIEELLGTEEKEQKALQNVFQYANEHYKRCLKVRHKVLYGESLEMLCSCVSANMSKVMTLEQIAEISKNTSEGRMQLGRMLMFVYQPCIKQPVYNSINDQCLSSQKNRYMMKKQRSTCGCIAERVSSRMNEIAEKQVERVMVNKATEFDPIDKLVPFEEYEYNFGHNTRVCIKKHELGYH